MTRRERIIQAIEAVRNMDADTLDNLLSVAYWMGREDEAKSLGDKVAHHLSKQRERAKSCRYHHMAAAIIGPDEIIYSPNYAGEYGATFGSDTTEL